MNVAVNIYAAIVIFILFGALCTGIGSAIGRSAERREQEERLEWEEFDE